MDERARTGSPVRVALVGAGAFGTMLLSQARRLRGLEVVAVADIAPARARAALERAGWNGVDVPAITSSAYEAIAAHGVDVVVEATGDPIAGADHAQLARQHGRHVVMVTVEADALAGPALAAAAREAGLVYSLAYGDQPALVCELVDWARASGFDVVCAGKGTKYLPAYHMVTPEEVWQHYGLSAEDASASGYSDRMFTSFLDGTKSAIEMVAVCNATGLVPQQDGLRFPPAGTDRLAQVCVPQDAGGTLSRGGTVEVVSSLERDGAPVANDLRWGVYVTFAAPSDYVAGCFADYGLPTDVSGRFAALWRPYHLIGLETSVSVLAAGLLGEATGAPTSFRADVVAVAKRDLAAGERLDGEGGHTVFGRLMPAQESCRERLLPIGLARGIALKEAVAAGRALRYADVEPPPRSTALGLRAALEQTLTGPAPATGSPPPTR
jgi:predicted homoserine dehydrogenase-like protein